VSSDGSGITMTLRMQGPPFGEVDVALDENDSKRFMLGMSKIAFVAEATVLYATVSSI